MRFKVRSFKKQELEDTDTRFMLTRKCLIPTETEETNSEFIAQEVVRDIGSQREIPHFDKSAVGAILKEAQRRAGRRGKVVSSSERTWWIR